MASSICSTYNVGLWCFVRFCESHNVSDIPASWDTVTYFAVLLSKTLSPAKIYISAVGAALRERRLQDPTRDNHRLRLVLKGIRRRHIPHASKVHHSITLQVLSKMLHATASCNDLSNFNQWMLSATFTLAFHGFLCVSLRCQTAFMNFSPSLSSLCKTCNIAQTSLHLLPQSLQNRSVLPREHAPLSTNETIHMPSPTYEGLPTGGL